MKDWKLKFIEVLNYYLLKLLVIESCYLLVIESCYLLVIEICYLLVIESCYLLVIEIMNNWKLLFIIYYPLKVVIY